MRDFAFRAIAIPAKAIQAVECLADPIPLKHYKNLPKLITFGYVMTRNPPS